MSKAETLAQLKEGKGISTAMLSHLQMSFEQWLRYVQCTDEICEKIDQHMIELLTTTLSQVTQASPD